jgi:hypothetical protein
MNQIGLLWKKKTNKIHGRGGNGNLLRLTIEDFAYKM